MQSGWVIIYVPGGDIYQMFEGPTPADKTTLRSRILRGTIKTVFTVAQLLWWLRSFKT